MFGLDDRIATLSDGTTMLVVLAASMLLGVRHASDPDHVAAVTTMIASGREHAAHRAARLGLGWGAGHATSLFVFGLPVVLYSAYLPAPVQAAAETTVGFVIVLLAGALLMRWRRPRQTSTRSVWQSYGIGLVHGMGGTAGIGVLLLATIDDHALAVAALGLFAFCSAVSMTLLSAGFGVALSSDPARRAFHLLAPVFGVVTLLFGVWYALGAQGLVPYIL
jgi:high-affinity nickel permease